MVRGATSGHVQATLWCRYHLLCQVSTPRRRVGHASGDSNRGVRRHGGRRGLGAACSISRISWQPNGATRSPPSAPRPHCSAAAIDVNSNAVTPPHGHNASASYACRPPQQPAVPACTYPLLPLLPSLLSVPCSRPHRSVTACPGPSSPRKGRIENRRSGHAGTRLVPIRPAHAHQVDNHAACRRAAHPHRR